MIVTVLAPLLLVAAAQSPAPTEPDPIEAYQPQEAAPDEVKPESEPSEAYPEEEPANGFEDEAPEEPFPPEDRPVGGQPVEPMPDEDEVDSAQEPEEGEDMVCRRVHYVDDFGRQRSRKSCRPR